MRSADRPLPAVGDVIRYAYLWSHEHDAGREEAVKDRPAAVVALIRRAEGHDEVAVLPVTSTPPAEPGAGVLIPPATRARLGLQAEPCWVVITEFNLFEWPGPDLRTVGADGSALYGALPAALMAEVRAAFATWRAARQPRQIRRTE